jgi:L-malate glycosyltransferase
MGRNAHMKTVLIIEEEMVHYRVPFYVKLQEALDQRQVDLRVGYSDPPRRNSENSASIDLPNKYGVKVRAYRGPGQRATFQPFFREACRADLVIVDQANRFLFNQLLLPASLLGLKRVAFWGHGRCVSANAVLEWYKRRTLNWVDWWFAYTRRTEEYLTAHGVPLSKITNIQNSIDTDGLRADLNSISEDELDRARKGLGISPQARVGIFCGTLYDLKCISLLLDAVKLVRSRVPDFHLVIIGGGTHLIGSGKQFPSDSEWIHYVGPRFGREKACLLKLGDVFLLPGAVGLAVLDAFVASLPLITTVNPHHGPEIEYLAPGKNGLVAIPTPERYALAIVDVLSDSQLLAFMRTMAEETGRRYSIAGMVENMCHGIERCLKIG